MTKRPDNVIDINRARKGLRGVDPDERVPGVRREFVFAQGIPTMKQFVSDRALSPKEVDALVDASAARVELVSGKAEIIKRMPSSPWQPLAGREHMSPEHRAEHFKLRLVQDP